MSAEQQLDRPLLDVVHSAQADGDDYAEAERRYSGTDPHSLNSAAGSSRRLLQQNLASNSTYGSVASREGLEPGTEPANPLAKSYRVLGLLALVFQYDYYVTTTTCFFRVVNINGGDPKAPTPDTLEQYGWIAASFALAALFAAPVFGAWGDRRNAAEPLVFGCLLMGLGNVLYALNWDKTWLLLLARLTSGAGSACRVAAVGYISKTSPPEKRGVRIGGFYAWGMLGMVLGPAAGSFFSQMPAASMDSLLSFGPGNFPALTSLGMDIIIALVVATSLAPARQPEEQQLTDVEDAQDGGAADVAKAERQSVGRYAMSDVRVLPAANRLLIFTQFILVLCVSTFETLVIPMLSKRFNWGQELGSLMLMGVGAMVLVSAIIAKCLRGPRCNVSMRALESTGLVIFLLGCAISFDWNQIIGACSLLDPDAGCDYKQYISLGVLMVLEFTSCVMVSLGFTFAFITTPGLFVHVATENLGSRILPWMGTHMAWLSIAASIAKVCGPLIIGYGLKYTANLMILVLVSLILVTSLLWACYWRRMR